MRKRKIVKCHSLQKHEKGHANYFKIFIRSPSMTHLLFWPDDLSLGPFEVKWVHMCFFFFVELVLENRKSTGMVPKWYFRRGTTTDTQRNILGSSRDRDISRSPCIWLNEKTRWHRIDVHIIPVALILLKVIRHKVFWWKPAILTFESLNY